MDNTKAHLHKTQINDRTLWYDGDSSFNPTKILKLVQEYDVKYVDGLNETIEQYNRNVPKQNELIVKDGCRSLSLDWTIPEQYKNLNVVEYIFDQHIALTQQMSEIEITRRDKRLLEEMVLYKKFKLFDVLRTIIYIINTLIINNIVWGIGRGSSVSSYVLYVLKVHDVDSYTYDLNIGDFLHD